MNRHVPLQEQTGPVCEECIAFDSGTDPSYWEGREDAYRHVERAALDWAERGQLVLSSVEEEPVPHFGGFCNVCGFMPYMGTVYDYRLTLFRR